MKNLFRNVILALPLAFGVQALQADPIPGQEIEGCVKSAEIEGYICAFASGTCSYHASTALDFIDHCGRPNGATVLNPNSDAKRCPVIREYYNGLFLSHEDWVKNTPCD